MAQEHPRAPHPYQQGATWGGWGGGGGRHCVFSTDFSHAFFLCSPNSRCEVLIPELGLPASRAVRPRTPAAEARSPGSSLRPPPRTRAPPTQGTVQLGVCSELETNDVCPVTSKATSESHHHPPGQREVAPISATCTAKGPRSRPSCLPTASLLSGRAGWPLLTPLLWTPCPPSVLGSAPQNPAGNPEGAA